ncbi:MAG: hypothetical protein CL792_03465 [Chloroflexi bacterium]|nr:hypothetical protein [Chloroflexota bacterium]|tara:strand:+ start:10 stop:525 length:516 start_codon:yes stop_codon:yes gene_type:complete
MHNDEKKKSHNSFNLFSNILPSLGPIALVTFSVLTVFIFLWGEIVADPQIEVYQFDAGSIEQFDIGKIVILDDMNFYLIGMEDGRIRAVDGRNEQSGCNVIYDSDDIRGTSKNPLSITGVLLDLCSDSVWALTGDAISGANYPLRTPQVTYKRGEEGILHVWVEVITVLDR